ncbi:MAG: class I SAM-dependent methyltransferase [Candidatus Aenigmarchaeota archaeon]|nr:class I SAM-dependent methyltransferase [Candidatus Aenigmarchaeota archaeon]
MKKIIHIMLEKTPLPVRNLLKRIGFKRPYSLIFNKYDVELHCQREWVKEFKKEDVRKKVLTYWNKYRHLDEIKKTCKFKKNTKVLDVGCGISSVLHFVDGEKYGIDPLGDEYNKIYSYPEDCNIKKGFSEDITYPDDFFDVVLCTNALDHVTDPEKSIEEIQRVLKPDGFFILAVEIFNKATKRDNAHPHSFTKEYTLNLIKDGFKVFETKETKWIGIINYVNGSRKAENKEFMLFLKNKKDKIKKDK